MKFEWTAHRFSGGALALDVANSVIMRHDDARRVDRFTVKKQLDDFCDAAGRKSSDPALPSELLPVRNEDHRDFFNLRESIDAFFRRRVGQDCADEPLLLADLLEQIALTLRKHPQTLNGSMPLDLATASSALALLSSKDRERMKICGNCGWLFIDRSRNRSRTWCDMTVCGNRAKAARHYRKIKDCVAC